MSDNNEFKWEKPAKIKLGFVKKLRLSVSTNKDDLKLEEILNTPIQNEIVDPLPKIDIKNSNNDIEIIE